MLSAKWCRASGTEAAVGNVQERDALRRERIDAAQIQHEGLLHQDEAFGVGTDAIDVRVVDIAADRHHGGQLTTQRTHLRAVAVDCWVSVHIGKAMPPS